MKFTVEAGTFREALAQARHATPANPSIVAYGGVLVAADTTSGRVRVTGSDGELTITSGFDATNITSGQVLLPPKPIASYLAALDASATVAVSLGMDGDVLVSAGSSPYRFRPLTSTFPAVSPVAGQPRKVNLSRLGAALAAVRHATSKEVAGVQLVSNDSGLVLNATDNYRVARAELPEAGFGDFVGLVPIGVLERVARLNAEAVSVDKQARTIVFHAPSAVVSSRLMSTAFPAVDTVLANVPPGSVKADVGLTLAALRRLSAVAEDSPVRIVLAGPRMELAVTNADLGAGVETVALHSDAAGETVLHAKLAYIVDALSACDASEAEIAFAGPTTPVFVTSTGSVRTVQVVAPVRV